jgi:hypothetical protein
MKKFTVLLLVFLASISINAQEKFETAAKATAAKMNEIVTLTEAQQKQIYEIELDKNIKKAEIQKEIEGNQEVIKEKVTKVNKEAYAAEREVIGAEKMKIWGDYRKEQLAKKE